MSLKITSFAHSWLLLTITFLNEAKTLSIAHTMMGNFCHGDEKKASQMENMGTDACVIVGLDNKVRLLSCFGVMCIHIMACITDRDFTYH